VTPCSPHLARWHRARWRQRPIGGAPGHAIKLSAANAGAGAATSSLGATRGVAPFRGAACHTPPLAGRSVTRSESVQLRGVEPKLHGELHGKLHASCLFPFPDNSTVWA